MSDSLRQYFLKIVVLCLIGFLAASCDQNSVSVQEGGTKKKIVDVSKNASLTVNKDNGGGPDADEGSSKLIDGDKNTKLFIGNYSGDFYVQQTFDDQVSVNAYTVTSGNDAPVRDPKSWTLKGSNDAVSWEDIETRSDVNFDQRNQVKIYHLESEVSYEYYRLAITSNNAENGAGNAFQFSEWRLLDYK